MLPHIDTTSYRIAGHISKMFTPRTASDFPNATYMSPGHLSSASCSAQDYIDGVLRYWDSQPAYEESVRSESAMSEGADVEPETAKAGAVGTAQSARPVVPQLQDYQQQLRMLESQNNKRILIAKERESPRVRRERAFSDQRRAAALAKESEEVPPIEGYRSYLLSVQAQTDDHLYQIREQEEEREAEERKQELERIYYMRRKDSGIYCDTIYKGGDEDHVLPEKASFDEQSARRSSRIDNWVEAQAQRRYFGLVDDAMLPKRPGMTVDAKLPQTAVQNIFSDFKCHMSGIQRYNEHLDQRRRLGQAAGEAY